MSTIDIILLVLFIPAVYKGLKDGFVRQAAGILGLLLGLFLASRFSELLGGYLQNWVNADPSIVKIIAFILIMIGVILCLNLLGKLVEKVFKLVMMGWLNRLLGLIFALAATALILGTLASVILYTNKNWFTVLSPDLIAGSRLFTPLAELPGRILPFLQEFF